MRPSDHQREGTVSTAQVLAIVDREVSDCDQHRAWAVALAADRIGRTGARRHLHRTEREAITHIMIGLGVLASLHNPHRIVSDDPKGLESGANAHRQFSPGVLWIFPGERRADAARGSQDAYRARKHRRPEVTV